MKIYLINGRTESVGQWKVEIFTSKFKAIQAFKQYMEAYGAKFEIEDDDILNDEDYHCAIANGGNDVFWLESRVLKFNGD